MSGLNSKGEWSVQWGAEESRNTKISKMKKIWLAMWLTWALVAWELPKWWEAIATTNKAWVERITDETKTRIQALNETQIKINRLETIDWKLTSSLDYINMSEDKKKELHKLIEKAEIDPNFEYDIVIDGTNFMQAKVMKDKSSWKLEIELSKFTYDKEIRKIQAEAKANYEIDKTNKETPLMINTWWITYKWDKDGNIYEIWVWWWTKWAYTKIWWAFPISQEVAIAAIWQFWEEELRWVIAAWWEITKTWTLMMSWSFAEKEWKFNVKNISWWQDRVEFSPEQIKLRIKYEQEIRSKIIKSLRSYELEVNASKSSNKKLETETIDFNEDFYKIVKRWVEWAKVLWAKAWVTFELRKWVYVTLKVEWNYINWNITWDKEFSWWLEWVLLIKDVLKENDSLRFRIKASEYEQRGWLDYSYPLWNKWWNAYVEASAWQTKYDEETDVRGMLWLRYEWILDNNSRLRTKENERIEKPYNNVWLVERLYNFADESNRDNIFAKTYYEEKLEAKPKKQEEPAETEKPKKKNPEKNNKAPIAVISVDKTHIKSWEEVKFDWSGSRDPDGKIAKYVWKNSAWEVIWTSLTITLKLTKSDTVTLQVSDEKWKLSPIVSQQITVDWVTPPNPEIDNPPTAKITWNNEVEKWQTTTLTCEWTDPEWKALTYLWNTWATTQTIEVWAWTYTCEVSDWKNKVTESVTVTEKNEQIDTTPPELLNESFNFSIQWDSFSWSMTFDEEIASISWLSISWNWTISANVVWKSIEFSWYAPDNTTSVNVSVTITDSNNNSRSVTSQSYKIM